MILVIDGHSYLYEMESLCDIFFPYEKVTAVYENGHDDSLLVYTGYKEENGEAHLHVSVKMEDRFAEKRGTFSLGEPDFERQCGLAMAVLLYDILVELTGYRPKWGVLIGVRPIKLLRKLTAEMGQPKAAEYFLNSLHVSQEKTALSVRTMQHEQPILAASKPESFSLYISIPFCPTRCAYCSFVAQSTEKTGKLIPQYVDLLCKELEYTAEVAKACNLRLETVYMGGGTPTTLNAQQLGQIIDTVNRNYDMSTCREFTVEAGRPDTITADKLQAMKERGITRISINPQTLNDEVLNLIGRDHTTQQTLDAFHLARAHGFDNINMDLIVGLAGDSVESFRNTLDGVVALHPESITVHTLALKRSSNINKNGKVHFINDGEGAGQMLDYVDTVLTKQDYIPYYLYRQSRMVGNLENTGWAKPGYENYYNVYIMDESHTILACGAGAVSKIKHPYKDELQRIFNFKFPYEYIDRYQEMLDRKEKVKSIYKQFLLSATPSTN